MSSTPASASAYSGQESNRVEVGRLADGTAVRDPKERTAGYFTTGQQRAAFIDAVKNERFG
ncbi:DUF397 domain-containing protein [Actinopolyspora erythraea]|uniref:DUF397 domain-containing protein n=1 Tax=Actinopolyspora erythraea TaxID=414996 RepID=A0A099D0N1_9ACTN|nr:DUF397 domain-containing protein [Actinopolyspora erythraea]ASU78022.1 DUF397 domain-containing protein [Actinopolyspora erythraea]KGI79788.1 hypothetical protein IL38_21565 [Actinopolyspora erythraea]